MLRLFKPIESLYLLDVEHLCSQPLPSHSVIQCLPYGPHLKVFWTGFGFVMCSLEGWEDLESDELMGEEEVGGLVKYASRDNPLPRVSDIATHE